MSANPASTDGVAAQAPATAEKNSSDATPANTAELTAVVDDLLESLTTKFNTVSAEIFQKIEAMSKRLDAMEQSLQQQQRESGTGKK